MVCTRRWPALDSVNGQRLEFAFDLKLQGTEQLWVTPVGRETKVQLSSTWPHPSFVGEFLPVSREISASGFSADWQTSILCHQLCRGAGRLRLPQRLCDAYNSREFGVSFVDPVDQYLKTDRAIKYALLFIALTFAGFFLFEVLKRLAVHPVQYGLVGLALALFYLLLLSLLGALTVRHGLCHCRCGLRVAAGRVSGGGAEKCVARAGFCGGVGGAVRDALRPVARRRLRPANGFVVGVWLAGRGHAADP